MSRLWTELLREFTVPKFWLLIFAWLIAILATGVGCPLVFDWLIKESELYKDNNLKLIAQLLKYVAYGLTTIFILTLFYQVYQIIKRARQRCRHLQSCQTVAQVLGRRSTAQALDRQQRTLPIELEEPQLQLELIPMAVIRRHTERSLEILEPPVQFGGNRCNPTCQQTLPPESSPRSDLTSQASRNQPVPLEPRRSPCTTEIARRRNTDQTTL